MRKFLGYCTYFSAKVFRSAAVHTHVLSRSRSSALMSSTLSDVLRKRGVSERYGSSTMGVGLMHALAIHSVDFSRFSAAASCASTAFISSSERTTSKEPNEEPPRREPPLRPPPPPLAFSSAAFSSAAFSLRCRRASRSCSRFTSVPFHFSASCLWRSTRPAWASCIARTRLATSGCSRLASRVLAATLRLYTGWSVGRTDGAPSCCSSEGSPLTASRAFRAFSAFALFCE